jgi:cytochrome b involved in lipid metabolism
MIRQIVFASGLLSAVSSAADSAKTEFVRLA